MATKNKDLFSYLELADYTASKGDDPFISMSIGAPGPSLLKGCSEFMIETTKQLLSDPSEEHFTFQYGPCQGDGDFCDQMAGFLTEQYGDKVDSADIMVTAGATQGLHLVSTVMFDKSTPIFMEDPSYFIAVKILREDFGMNIIPVPTDDNGPDVDRLEELLKQHKPASLDGCKTPFWSMIYTIPTFNNPKGICTSPDRCKALVRLARQYDVLLFAEDVYNMIHYNKDGHCPPRLLSYDKRTDQDFKGHVISNCTFSKILAPGLRLGWIEAPPRIIQHLVKAAVTWSGGSFNHYMSKLMATAVKNGSLSAHVKKLRQEYTERVTIVCNALRENLPSGVKFSNPAGGLFVWLELPPSIDAAQLLKMAVEKYRINFIAGANTSPTGCYKNFARLSICFCDKDLLKTGISRFCDALRDQMAV